ncbi:MAG: VanW family protein [Lachnospiraceae bacterium]|nr:VanW family protein [Lachnospiraceae bacterium]
MSVKMREISREVEKKRKEVRRTRNILITTSFIVAAFVIAGTGMMIFGNARRRGNSENYNADIAQTQIESLEMNHELSADEAMSDATIMESIAEDDTMQIMAADDAQQELPEAEAQQDALAEDVQPDSDNQGDATVFSNNIFVEGIDLGGQSIDTARELVRERLNGILNEPNIKIGISTDEYLCTFNDVGVTYDEQKLEEILQDAVVYGNHGTLITKYKERTTTSKSRKDYDVEFDVNDEIITQKVTELSNSYIGQMPKNAEIHRINGKFEITDEVRGVGLDIADTTAAIRDALTGWKEGVIEIKADAVESMPEITAEQLYTIKDLLGSFETQFSGSPNTGRGQNLMNGVSKIDDKLLMPGETLSVYNSLIPFTIENGYAVATAYANGGYVDSIGGGICQIATTLYNACLRAEMEVVKRSNHSMVVGYVDRAFDSTVNDNGSKDLIIRNNFNTPVYLEAYLYDMKVCIRIYGAETRDPNRRVEYYSEVLSETYADKSDYQYIVVRPGNPQYSPVNGHLEEELVGPDEILQIQGDYPACTAKLYKRVIVNDQIVEETCLHTDRYKMSPAKFLVGVNYNYPGKHTPAPTPTPTPVPTPEPTPEIPTEPPVETPDVPVEPEIPDVPVNPETPDVPVVPEPQPEIPVVPELPPEVIG